MKSRQRKEGKIGDEREKAATVDGVGRRRRCGWEVMPVMEPLVAESTLVTLMSVCNDARANNQISSRQLISKMFRHLWILAHLYRCSIVFPCSVCPFLQQKNIP